MIKDRISNEHTVFLMDYLLSGSVPQVPQQSKLLAKLSIFMTIVMTD